MRQTITARLEPKGKGGRVPLPFDPNEIWGHKDRHHVTGVVGGCKVRGELKFEGERWYLNLGPAWVRDNLKPGTEVQIELAPEGPALAADVVTAFAASTAAQGFFES